VSLTFHLVLRAGKEGSSHQVLVMLSKDQSARLGTRRTVNVTGTLNGLPFQNSFLPAGEGRHYLVISRALRTAAQVEVGDQVTLVFEIEHAPRPVTVPEDVHIALAQTPAAQTMFEKLSPSHQREYLGFVTEAKKPETRARRLKQMVTRLLDHT
jgi:hypothetical protein